MAHIIGDLGGTWHLSDWTLVCRTCSHRASSLAYNDLPPWFYQLEVRGCRLWAFNRDHFEMLLCLINGESIADNPYEWFSCYVHREWLRQSRRRSFVKPMRRILLEHGD